MHQLSQKGRRAVMLLITVLFWFALYVYVPYQTPYLSMLGVASSFIGVILGAYGFSQMLIRIPLGIGAGSQRAAQAVYRFWECMCGSGLGAALSLAQRNFFSIGKPDLRPGRLNLDLQHRALPDLLPARAAQKAMGTLLAMNNLGTLSGFLLGMVASQFLKTEALFLFSAGAGLLGTVCSILIWEEPQEQGQAKMLPPLREHFRVFKKAAAAFRHWHGAFQAVNMSTAMSFTSEYGRQMGAGNLKLVCFLCCIWRRRF